jgi:hypothetical protein
MSQRIRGRFLTYSYASTPAGIFTLVVRIFGLGRATLILTTTDDGLSVTGFASKSAGVLYKRVGNFFTFKDHDEVPNVVVFEALARNRVVVVQA